MFRTTLPIDLPHAAIEAIEESAEESPRYIGRWQELRLN
jgi:hypothetical protein